MYLAWLLVSDEVQSILASRHDWRTLTCTEEQLVESEEKTPRKVEREGVKIREVRPDDKFVKRGDRGIEAWKARRADRGKRCGRGWTRSTSATSRRRR
jgi:ergosteryl-3beta-O-L-aspartate synthase